MKKLILILVFLISLSSFGQIVKMQVQGQKELTTTQRNALVVPVGEFWQIYNITTNRWEYWDGNSWEVLDTGIIAEVDGSITNELQTLATTSGATTHTTTLSNSGGSQQMVEGTGISLTTTGTGLDGIVTIANTGIITEVDGSITNEGSLTVTAGSGTTSVISSNTSGSTGVTVTAGTGLSISEAGNVITLANTGVVTEVDGSTSNELQTIANTSAATTHTATLSNSGGSLQLAEGSNITLTTTGTGLDGIVTIASTAGGGNVSAAGNIADNALVRGDGGATGIQTSGINIDDTNNMQFPSGSAIRSGQGNNNTLLIQGYDVNGASWTTFGTLTSSNNPTFDLSTTVTVGGNPILTTEVDGSITNEGSLTVGAGTATTSLINSNTSGSTAVTLTAGSNITLSEVGNAITIAAAGGGESTTVSDTAEINLTLTGSDISGVLVASSIDETKLDVSTNASLDLADTALQSEVDGSVTNEIQDISVTGTTTATLDLTSDATDASITGAGISAISVVGNAITVTSTEVDGSTSNELQTIANTSGATTHTATLSNSGGSLQLAEGANITLTTSGTGLDGIVTIAASGGAGATNLATTHNVTDVIITSDTGTDATINLANGTTAGVSENNLTDAEKTILGNTSGTNSGNQTIANTSDATTHTQTLSSSGGSTQYIEGTGISLTTGGTGLNGTLTIANTGIVSEVDGSITNEGSLTVAAGTGTTSIINSNTSGQTGVTLTAGTNMGISEAGNVITLTSTDQFVGTVTSVTGGTGVSSTGGATPDIALTVNELAEKTGAVVGTDRIVGTSGTTNFAETISGIPLSIFNNDSGFLVAEVDGSTSNELQTIANTSDATTHTQTLSNSGGSLQFVEGSNITLTTSGTGLNGIVTIASTGGGTTDLSYTGVSSPVTLNSSTGADVTITSGTGISLTGTSGNVTIANTGIITEVDGSTTNEVQDFTITGVSSPFTIDATLTSNDVSFAQGGIVALSESPANTLVISATEVDGSVSNEGSLTVAAGTGTTSIINSNTSGQTGVTLTAAGINAITESGNVITLTATEVDGSVSNEGSLTVTAGTGTTSVIGSNTSGSTAVTLTSGTGLSISEVGNVITLANTGIVTEVDGSITNEGSLTVGVGTGTTSIINSNTSGQTGVTLTAAGINAISEVGNVITLTATEVDGSVSNELQTIANTSDATTHTATLSNSGGSLQLAEGSNITLTTTGTGLNGIVTIASTGGGGNVTKVGTPVDNQLGVWTGDGTIEGDADLTFDGTSLTTTGNINASKLFSGGRSGSGTYDLDVSTTFGTATTSYTSRIINTATQASLLTFNSIGTYSGSTYTGSTTQTNALLAGVQGIAQSTGGRVQLNAGGDFNAVYSGADTGANNSSLYGVRSDARITGNGVIEHIMAYKANPPIISGTGVANYAWGLYVADQDVANATNSSAIHIEGNGTGNSISFSGNTSAANNISLYSTGVDDLAIAGGNLTLTAGNLTATNLSGTNTGDETQSSINALNVDADTIDTLDSSSFLRSDAATTKTSGNLTFNDGLATVFGTGADMLIWHNGTNNRIQLTAGDLQIYDGGATPRFNFARTTGDLTAASFNGVALTTGGSATAYLNATGTYSTPAGGGTIGGSITDNQIAVGATTANNIEGSSGFTYDSATFSQGVGVNDTNEGVVNLYGNSSTSSGELRIYNGASNDTNNEYWAIKNTGSTLTFAGQGASLSSLQMSENQLNFYDINGGSIFGTSGTGSGNTALIRLGSTLGNGFYVDVNKATSTMSVVSGDVTVQTEVYGAGWNGSNEVPTKDAVYDKIQLGFKPTLSKGVTIPDIVATDDPTLFFTPVAITITDVRSHITGTTNVVYNINHASTRTGTGLDVFTADITLTSTAGQSNNSGFSDNTIPANSWVWLDTVSVSGTPTLFHATIIYTED